ncbi:hypothetical protein AOQ84DRAFT_6468 [Glonium stellatum]|uniref:Uncharacterized protein n=1 Tax=Glonium stellatum TaxID=574774 RepID=A0A8E2F464_9PEZI|nr:hypothetical protein AOQ84DRAFT_6468 [Glonium stellatum]
MAPTRRYLRITKHSVLEVRIYLERPSDSESWLLRRDNPALPRVIEAVRPLVLPKLREENEKARGRAGGRGKKKGVKDVVVGDDFDVSIFLTELSSRHTLLTKHKSFQDKPRLRSNSGKLTGWLTAGTSDQPVGVPEDDDAPMIREEDKEDAINLDDIPETSGDSEIPELISSQKRSRRSKRRRQNSEEGIFVGDSDDSAEYFQTQRSPPIKRNKRAKERETDPAIGDENEDDGGGLDDKKKLRMDTSYDGFSIYGRVLCLVIKRKGSRPTVGESRVPISSQQMLENWVSTQAAAEQGDGDDV